MTSKVFRSVGTCFRVGNQCRSFSSDITVILVNQVLGGLEVLIAVGGIAEHEFHVSFVEIIEDAVFTRGLFFIFI